MPENAKPRILYEEPERLEIADGRTETSINVWYGHNQIGRLTRATGGRQWWFTTPHREYSELIGPIPGAYQERKVLRVFRTYAAQFGLT